MPRSLRALSALLLALVPFRAAEAQAVSLTLSQDAALWNDVVVARLEGSLCRLDAASPEVGFTPGVGWTVDIDVSVEACNHLPPLLTTLVEIGPLYPQDYIVRVFEVFENGQPTLAATAPLKVYREASLDVVLPEAATDAAPFTLTFRGPASSACYILEPEEPLVQGRTITMSFSDNCPIIPVGEPRIFAEPFQVGPLPAGEYGVRFFEHVGGESRPRLHRQTLTVHDADGCVPSETTLCLQGGRFRVEVDWKDFENHTGKGHAIPLEGRDDSGLFWYFREENIELTVKVLNGCGLGNHWWVFLSSGSTVEYTVTVTDTLTGRTKTYTNDRGEAAPLVADTAAFSCNP